MNTEDNFTVYFGGGYEEHWSEDYRLTVTYSGRLAVNARRTPDGFVHQEPLPSLPLAEEYFDAACHVQEDLRRAHTLAVPAGRVYEVNYYVNRITPFELLRALLDDEGLEFEAALAAVARCCPEVDFSVCEEELCKLQPRTAHLIHILETALAVRCIAVHDSRSEEYRSPPGALKTGQSARFSVLAAGGGISAVSLSLFGDSGTSEYQMMRDGSVFSVDITMQAVPAALWYCFRLSCRDGEYWLCPDESGFYGKVSRERRGGFRLTVYRADFTTPEWFRGAVMYQIFPDRFAFTEDGTAERGVEYHRALGQTPELHKSADEPVRYRARSFEANYEPDDFYGGTLRGIEQRLPYIKSLGANVIYLNPIVEARSNHRYDTSDYLKVDPVLGTDEDFQRLCQRAGELGIRLMLDGVFSHTGSDSVYFNRYGRYPGKGACQGGDSPYYKWYNFRCFPEDYKCWWNFQDLPEVDEENPQWQDFVVTGGESVVKTWLRRGSSGWRLDVADELPDDVLSLIRQSAKAEKPDAAILGEVWEDAVLKVSYGGRRNYALGNSLDSVMNYPLRGAVLDFMHGRTDAFALRDFLDSQRLNYPGPMYGCLMNLMGSHDVERLRTNLGSDTDVKTLSRDAQASYKLDGAARELAARREKLCAAIQFSLPGVPSVYYGDEVGMEGCRDPFNRLPWREGSLSPLEFYKKLGAIRASYNVMSTCSAEFSASGPDVLIIKRFGDGQCITTVVNRAGEPRRVFNSPGGRDLITGALYPSDFTAEPYSAAILERQ